MAFHEGLWLKSQVARTSLSQSGFAKKSGISRGALSVWFRQKKLSIRPDMMPKLLDALGLTERELDDQFRLASGYKFPPLHSIDWMLASGLPVGGESPEIEGVPDMRLVSPPTPLTDPRLMRPVPIINKVAAGALAERTDLGYPAGVADDYIPLPVGNVAAFGLWVDGDSMAPRYLHGDLVIFRQLDPDAENVREGEDHAIQLDGWGYGESAFKRIFYDHKKGMPFVLAKPLNPASKPKQISIDLRQVIRLGAVMMILPCGKRSVR